MLNNKKANLLNGAHAAIRHVISPVTARVSYEKQSSSYYSGG